MAEEKKDSKKSDEKRAQELYMELSMLSQQSAEFQKQIQQLEETIQELENSKQGIDELKSKKGKEILVPVVSGIFVKADLKTSDEFIVNVGANTAVTKSLDEVQSLLDKQLKEIQKTQDSMIDNLQKMTVREKELKQELRKVMG
jgi:prefoldin alpha subunit